MTDTAEAPAQEPTQEPIQEQSNADIVAGAVEEATDYSFVLDKYRAEDRTDSEAAIEQAKAYKELQGKFGSFTGAPEEYDIALSEELSEKINLEDFSEDPILQDAKEMAKEWGMSNDGFNQMAELYFRGQLADVEAADQVREQEFKALGNNAQRRLDNIQDWAKVNLDSENATALLDGLTTASSVQAVEALIAKTRNAPQVQNEPSAPAVSHDKVREMMVAKDEFGQPKMNDPAYNAKVKKLYGQLFGEEPNSVTVG